MFLTKRDVQEVVEAALSAKDKDSLRAADLKKEIVRLEIERDKKQEEWDRGNREIEHKIGLERKRQEFEIEQAKRDTEVTVREENLKADKERFKSEMDFQRKRLEQEVASLKELVSDVLKRLPNVEIIATAGAREKK